MFGMVVGFGCPEVGLGILNRCDLNVLIRPFFVWYAFAPSRFDVRLDVGSWCPEVGLGS